MLREYISEAFTARDNLRSVQEELQFVSNESQNKVTSSDGECFPVKQTGTLDETRITIGFVDKRDAGIVKFYNIYCTTV
jgi:hypothetical protein